jgi:DNA-binding NarL/FixJ family response regulator
MGELTATPAFVAVGGSRLYERDRELERIEVGLGMARAGTGTTLVLEGPAGIGKTSLGRAARVSAAEAGMTVLVARGTHLERDFAWGVARQWFGTELAGMTAEQRRGVLSGAAGLAANALDDPPSDARAEPCSPATMHGLHWLVANLAQRAPLLLVLDDAHWADEASVRLVSYLGGRVADMPVFLLVATRPVAHGAAPHSLVAVLSDPDTTVIRPAPLSELALRAFVEGRTRQACDPDFAHACRLVTGGNPFLVGELVRALVEADVAPSAEAGSRVADLRPHAMSTTILGRLSAEAQALARAAAVLDDDAGLSVGAELAGLSVEAAAHAAAELTRAGLLEDALPLRFVHALVRDAVLDGLHAGERSAAHAQAARALREHGAPSHRVAAHLMAAQPRGDQSVVQALREAAEDALRRGDPAASAAALARAVSEPVQASDRPALLEELAVAKLLARDPAAADHLRNALDVAPDVVAQARLAALLGEALLFANQRREANDVMTAARMALGDRHPTAALLLDTQLAQLGWTTASLAAAQESRLEHLRAVAEREGARAGALRLTLAMRDVLRGLPASEAVREIRRVLDDGFLATETSESVSAVQAVGALAFVDALEDADRLLDEMSNDAAKRGSPIGYAAVGTWRAYVALRRGRVTAAEGEARVVLEHLRAYGLPFAAGFATAYLGIALTEQGRLAEAGSALDGLPLDPVAGTVGEPTLREARGLLRWRQGRVSEAIAEFRACGSVCDQLMIANPAVYAWRSSLALALPADKRGEALTLVEAELAAARVSAVPRAIAIALRADALLAGSDGVVKLRGALEALEGCPSGLERGTTLLHLGAALRRNNRRIDARVPLHAALELARANGATHLANSARRELRAAGSRPRDLTRTGIDSLSPQEHRIATMASDGRSNPDIAQALFLSRKTVEMHLGHAYRKLGVASRRDLPGALTAAP